jgi:hypothetical protein
VRSDRRRATSRRSTNSSYLGGFAAGPPRSDPRFRDFLRRMNLPNKTLHSNPPQSVSSEMNLAIFLCPVYLRGEAYLMLHDGTRAAAEFQKFIDH